ncbi:hypothetical protein EV401DRAFT_2021332 [Pisolithus croceorrhizus]|nr:hypothetical protein EV401DRAFT_2021332 [Pisolithus croceorrhizus]
MDPQSARSYAGDFNPRSYAPNDVLGPQPTQAKLDPDAAVCPTDLRKTEVADSSSLPCHPGHVDQPHLSDVAAWPALAPTRILYNDIHHAAHKTNQNPVYAPTHINYLGESRRGEHSNRQIQHHPITHHATSGVIVAGIGPAKAGNRRSGANPGSVSQKKGYHNCEQKKCLYPGPNGTRCLQEISCATVPEHFVSHGITIKPREMILCQWEECSEKVVRHNFVRHVREKHLGHVRGSATRNSKKERGCCAFNTGSVEAETSR